ncbi:NAD-dependent epimerase/dehydratase family protein [Nonlabens sp. Asnod3-A02]|uniref:NAD-dependent epimerase/dehydratase family protein n=1 Tax=Nonlabens sp. Asnod3-A02 TaxID=3160579 RepID=UPI00386AAE89
MAKILITCAGSGVGQSVLDALNLRREHYLIGCDGNLNVMARTFCDEFFEVPGIYDDNYIDVLISKSIELEIDLIIPGHDHELALFSNLIDRFNAAGLKVLVSLSDLIEVSRDKQEWYNFFAPKGCNIVPTLRVDEFLENPNEAIIPAIVKPSGGSASQGISIINKLEDLVGLNGEDIIQPYLFPEKLDSNYLKIKKAVEKGVLTQLSEISIQFVFDKESELRGLFISRNTLKSGVPIYIEPIDPDSFDYMDQVMKFVPIFKKYAVVGPVNIQGRITENDIFFFEMNMRFTGITGNRSQLGFNEVEFLVNNFLELPTVELKKYAYNKVGARQVGCTTLPKIDKKRDVLFILGAGSNLGLRFVLNNQKKYKFIYIAYRDESKAKYQKLFSDVKNVQLVESNSPSTQSFLAQSDVLVNFVSALAFHKDPLKFDAISYIYNLIPKIVKANISTVINISSQSVYDQTLVKEKVEEDEVSMLTTYGFQKKIIEDFFNSLKTYLPRVQVSSIRAARIIDPKIPGTAGFFGKLVQSSINNDPMEVIGGSNTTNLVHVNDVVNGINFLVEKSEFSPLSAVYNLGGENISIKEFCIAIGNTLKQPSVFSFPPVSVENEVLSSMIDSSKIKNLGFNETTSLKDIIVELSSNL